MHEARCSSAPSSSPEQQSLSPSLATFGIVLTGRLGLKNDLMSTFSVENVCIVPTISHTLCAAASPAHECVRPLAHGDISAPLYK